MTGRWRRARVVASAGLLVAGAWGAGSAHSPDEASAPTAGEVTLIAERTGTTP